VTASKESGSADAGQGSVPADSSGTIEVSVSDTGSGIGEEELGKIFNPYFTTKKLGIGLGLAITKKIVEEHGGRISVTSRALEGTTVVIGFPINEVTEVAV
jgi:signal transduction histidine kinase